MRHIIFLISFALIFSSCKNNPDNSIEIYKLAEESLQQSIKNISLSTEEIIRSFDEKLIKDETKEQTEIWQPKVLAAKVLTDSIIKYIKEVKVELKNEAGGGDSKEVDWMSKSKVSKHVFESHGKGKELLERLVQYKKAILGVDPKINAKFGMVDNYLFERIGYSTLNPADEIKPFSNDIPVAAAFVTLSKLENTIIIMENSIARFCLNQIGYFEDGRDMYSILIGQSSNYLKAGSDLVVTAMMGSYTNANKPQFMINGVAVPGKEGYAECKLKVPSKAGKYFVPIKIEFTFLGKKQIETKTVSYTVVE